MSASPPTLPAPAGKLDAETEKELKKLLTVVVGTGIEYFKKEGDKKARWGECISIIVLPRKPIEIRKGILSYLRKHLDRKDRHCRATVSWQKTTYTLEPRIIEVKDGDRWVEMPAKYDVLAEKDGTPFLRMYCYAERFVNDPDFHEPEVVETYNDLPGFAMGFEDEHNDGEKIADRLFCAHAGPDKSIFLCEDCRKFVCNGCKKSHEDRSHRIGKEIC